MDELAFWHCNSSASSFSGTTEHQNIRIQYLQPDMHVGKTGTERTSTGSSSWEAWDTEKDAELASVIQGESKEGHLTRIRTAGTERGNPQMQVKNSNRATSFDASLTGATSTQEKNSSSGHLPDTGFDVPRTRCAAGVPSHKGDSGGSIIDMSQHQSMRIHTTSEGGGSKYVQPKNPGSVQMPRPSFEKSSTPANQGSSSNPGKTAAETAAKPPRRAPKCEYCKEKQKKGGEVFHQQPELVRRCPAYANLGTNDLFCKSCTQYLYQLFIARR